MFPKDNTSINVSSADYLLIYPNPSSGTFTVANREGADIVIYGVTGKALFRKSNIGDNEILRTDLVKGFYFVSVEYRGNQEIKKILIK